MSDTQQPTQGLFDQALLDPGAVFCTPHHVVESGQLSAEQKITVLRRWAYDAAELAVAVEEGMPDGDSDLLRQVQLELAALNAPIDPGHSGPTKHHGLSD